ncbi:hypothetical protein FF36_06364 [Frankia torreyi]|uniref:Uncharacterized protein n=1 Tax=Frankia torreyi TaxID=1856 RepID=A0A0D8B611_9ACTN|nr:MULTISPECIES: hypothetical protein [Frankia]KJE19359.1 hypothetical protein FF36_06364 [Frankia torreyi]KQM02637.1 hypothetical protein FF86_106028 [Frankia sp. CpI1-P]
MTALHGIFPGGIEIPPGKYSPAGRFGHLFPDLPARPAIGIPLAEQHGRPGGKTDAGTLGIVGRPHATGVAPGPRRTVMPSPYPEGSFRVT